MNNGTKFCRLSQAFTTHYPNVFTPILALSEGRAGIAWASSNKLLIFFPSDIKRLSLSPQMFSLFFYSYTILSDSLSLSSAILATSVTIQMFSQCN
jgi:hypothetical protein